MLETLLSLQGWGQLFACSCKLVQTNTKMLSDKVFFWFFFPLRSLMRTKKRTGRGGRLPEPRTLVKGNYILIPFWNLVYIWLPGTSANCLQCLSLCLLGACVLCLCEHTGHTHTHIHARRHIQDSQRSWLAQNTAHAGVITMQVDYSIYLHLLSLHSDYFSSACRTGVMLLRDASKRIPQLPHICMKVLKCFQSLVFYVYLSDVRGGRV